MWNSSALHPRDVPIETDAAEAQRWATDELEKAIYNDQPTLWERFLRWLGHLIANLFDGTTSMTSTAVVLILAAALIAAAVIVFLYRGRLQRNRTVADRRDRSATLFEDSRTSDNLWVDARAAAGRGEFTPACLDAFRALVRSLDERVLLDETPGMTAHEASLAGTQIFPGLAPSWTWCGALFDSLAYGDRAATGEDWNAVNRFAADVDSAHPERRLAVAQ